MFFRARFGIVTEKATFGAKEHRKRIDSAHSL